MGVLLEDQESESRRLGPWLELPPSPPRSVWAAVVAAWVSCWRRCRRLAQAGCSCGAVEGVSPPDAGPPDAAAVPPPDRKSTRLDSSHLVISYAVFCLKKKKQIRWIMSLSRYAHHSRISAAISLWTMGIHSAITRSTRT